MMILMIYLEIKAHIWSHCGIRDHILVKCHMTNLIFGSDYLIAISKYFSMMVCTAIAVSWLSSWVTCTVFWLCLCKFSIRWWVRQRGCLSAKWKRVYILLFLSSD